MHISNILRYFTSSNRNNMITDFEILEGVPVKVKFLLEDGAFVTADIFDLSELSELAYMYLNDAFYYKDEIIELGKEYMENFDYKVETENQYPIGKQGLYNITKAK